MRLVDWILLILSAAGIGALLVLGADILNVR
jgi:hypothetical protein